MVNQEEGKRTEGRERKKASKKKREREAASTGVKSGADHFQENRGIDLIGKRVKGVLEAQGGKKGVTPQRFKRDHTS